MREEHLQELPDQEAEIERAFEFLVEKRQLSKDENMTGCTSYIQRKLRCGYNYAALLMDRMVERGWITKTDSRGARRITRRARDHQRHDKARLTDMTPNPLPIWRTNMHDIIDSIVRDIAELPDRISPEGQPDVMLVSDGELRDILWRHLEHR